MDLTEAEEMKWQEYTEPYKKSLNDPGKCCHSPRSGHLGV